MVYSEIYDVSDDLVLKLTDAKLIHDIQQTFLEQEQNFSKVNFVEQLLVDRKYIEEILSNFTLRDEKCNVKSLKYRKLGNEQFFPKNKNYFQALELYNKSICFAEPGSGNLSIGYANRSAVFFQLKRYRECLDNIKLAREANFPTFLTHKLDKRESDCLQLLASQEPDVVPYDFQMSYAPHPLVPNIAECLEMAETPEQGRFIRTTRDLAVGDLVATEEPFCSTLLAPMRYIRCATCKIENCLTLIPCEKCCSTMFCSESCRAKAMDSFHKFECPIIDLLHNFFIKIHLMALRVCLSVVELLPTVEELMSFCNDPENEKKSVFDLDYTNLTPREHYRAIHGLVTNQDKRPNDDLFQRSVVCAVLKYFIIEYTPLKEFLGNEEGENVFTELLFRHLQTSPVNGHNIDLVEQKNETKDDESHSVGIFPFMSLLNNSCAPNTLRICKGTKMYLFVLRPIEAGEKLYDTYAASFYLFSRAQRQHRLSFQYLFICECEACVNDYPLFWALPTQPFVPRISNILDHERLITYDYEFALKNYRKYCTFLKKYATAYPCNQLCEAEQSLKMALQILVDTVPFKAKMNKEAGPASGFFYDFFCRLSLT